MSEKEKTEINIIYDITKGNEIKERYNIKGKKINKLKIKLEGINNVTNMSYMFSECSSLSSLPDISKWNTNNVTSMISMFYRSPNIIFSKVTQTIFK